MDVTTGRTALPIGTVTFLRTDVEGSMALARAHGEAWDRANATHLGLIRRAVDAGGGVCVRTEGDSFFGAFQEAGAAVRAAVHAQRALAGHDWPPDIPVRVRMALHTGEAHLAGDDYGGFEVNRAARIAAAGHGGQVILSEATRLLIDGALPDDVTTRDLGRHVLRDVPAPVRLHQLDIRGLQSQFPPLRTSRPSTGNLPERLTSFIGREAEIDELAPLLETTRLLTLTGPGGIGKTSLAVELARGWLDRAPDGAWLVRLDELRDPGDVPPEIARSLGLFDGPNRPAGDALERHLAERAALLVLDNFEHVLSAASVVTAILRASPASRLIVTSRAPLRIAGEQEYPVRTLADGTAGADLFAERARAVRPGWTPGPDGHVVDEIVTLVDGLPLGVELAAARVALLPLRAIRDRLHARLPLPGSGPRDAPERQRTLEATIVWSLDLLHGDQQRLLHDLAVFDGSFDVEQAAHVAGGDVLDGLATLAEHSLLAAVLDEGQGSVRYRLLETIRSVALERLVGEDRHMDVRRRHAQAYLALLEAAAPYLPGGDQGPWLDRLVLDQPNIRAATRWAIETGAVELALRLVGRAWRFWQLAGYLSEGAEMTEAALSMPGARDAPEAYLTALAAAGGIAYWRADVEAATRRYREQLALAVALGDRVAEADAHFNLMFTQNLGEGADAAAVERDRAERLYEELGDERGLARALWARATLTMNAGDARAAIRMFKESADAFTRTGDAWYHAMAVGSISWAGFAMGDLGEAIRWALQSIVEYRAMRDITSTTITLAALARVAFEGGRIEDAAVLLGAFDALCDRYGVRPPSSVLHHILGGDVDERLKDVLDPDILAQSRDHGARMSLDEAVDLADEVCQAVLADMALAEVAAP